MNKRGRGGLWRFGKRGEESELESSEEEPLSELEITLLEAEYVKRLAALEKKKKILKLVNLPGYEAMK